MNAYKEKKKVFVVKLLNYNFILYVKNNFRFMIINM